MPNPPEANQPKTYSNSKVISFVIMMCVICGFLLATVAYSLQGPQTEAKEFDQSKQMLIAAKILSYAGYFELLDPEGNLTPASFDSKTKTLVPASEGQLPPKATDADIREVAALRIRPLLTDEAGNVYTLEEKQLVLPDYLSKNKKTGYAKLPLKLFYAILPNTAEAQKISAQEVAKDLTKAETIVIPVSGFGLWAPIYGYLAIRSNGDSVVGATWYEHAETPGLGANIAEPWWQKQFYGKEIFLQSPDGSTDFKTASMGIIVVKGKVQDVFGSSPKANSAVDGMSGATLTGDGVTQAYLNSLSPYRNFLIKVHQLNTKEESKDGGKRHSP